MNKSGCTPFHNLSISKDLVVICPEIQDPEALYHVQKVAQWYIGETKRKITYLLCDQHKKNYVPKDSYHTL